MKDMKDLLRKNMLVGLGLIAMTQAKAREYGEKLVKESKLPEAEGEKFLKDLTKQYNTSKKHIEARVSEMIDKNLKRPTLPCNAGFEKMAKELKTIKKAIAKLESKMKS